LSLEHFNFDPISFQSSGRPLSNSNSENDIFI
jgi:hypothetical protein